MLPDNAEQGLIARLPFHAVDNVAWDWDRFVRSRGWINMTGNYKERGYIGLNGEAIAARISAKSRKICALKLSIVNKAGHIRGGPGIHLIAVVIPRTSAAALPASSRTNLDRV